MIRILALVLLVVVGCAPAPLAALPCPQAPPALERVKALAVAVCEPAERWQDCLVRLEALPPDPTPPPSSATGPPGPSPTEWAAMATAVIAALASAAAIVIPVSQGGP